MHHRKDINENKENQKIKPFKKKSILKVLSVTRTRCSWKIRLGYLFRARVFESKLRGTNESETTIYYYIDFYSLSVRLTSSSRPKYFDKSQEQKQEQKTGAKDKMGLTGNRTEKLASLNKAINSIERARKATDTHTRARKKIK